MSKVKRTYLYLLELLFGKERGIEAPFSVKADIKKNDSFSLTAHSGVEPSTLPITILDVPSYHKVHIVDTPSKLKTLYSPLYEGFLIDLTPYNNTESYLKEHFKSSIRNRFRARKKKLDQCVQPTVQFYYGSIDTETYHTLFDRLEVMLSKRFEQKEVVNYEIPFIPIYRELFFGLIHEHKACIYAIYDHGTPICMAISFKIGNTLYLFDTAYDIDYAIFGLGNQLMIDHIDWAFEKGITKIDMSRGDFLHKRKWINQTFLYQQIHILPKGVSTLTILYLYQWLRNHLRYKALKFLKKFGVQHLYAKILQWRYRIFIGRPKHLKEELNNWPQIHRCLQIPVQVKSCPWSQAEFAVFKPLAYSLCFKEKLDHPLELFQDIKDCNLFYLQSGSHKFTFLKDDNP